MPRSRRHAVRLVVVCFGSLLLLTVYLHGGFSPAPRVGPPATANPAATQGRAGTGVRGSRPPFQPALGRRPPPPDRGQPPSPALLLRAQGGEHQLEAGVAGAGRPGGQAAGHPGRPGTLPGPPAHAGHLPAGRHQPAPPPLPQVPLRARALRAARVRLPQQVCASPRPRLPPAVRHAHRAAAPATAQRACTLERRRRHLRRVRLVPGGPAHTRARRALQRALGDCVRALPPVPPPLRRAGPPRDARSRRALPAGVGRARAPRRLPGACNRVQRADHPWHDRCLLPQPLRLLPPEALPHLPTGLRAV
ncbi:basic salivary proline-rich protein 4-like isoform X2 [Mobula hypostoma]|uniref:basic salivary proline-rich protein 4-like isoform X2 n=1 Tax=Mobula hypostoma TaxID=723540 RepID=UPI002FC3B5B0